MIKLIIGLLIIFIAGLAALYYFGTLLTRPTPSVVTKPKTSIPLEAIHFTGFDEIQLKGWLAQNHTSTAGVLLMHGNQSNRLSMLSRAEFLYQAGYSVMLFDLRAHGESEGNYRTFGYLEAKDAQHAINFFKQHAKLQKVGVIGSSLGGAAVVLNERGIAVDAMVLEAVYPTIEKAVVNRLTGRFGKWSSILEPLLTHQLPLRFGIKSESLQPVNQVKNIQKPALVIAGAQDQRTTLEDTQWLYQSISANEKSLWVIANAAHENFHIVATQEYEKRVLGFFGKYL